MDLKDFINRLGAADLITVVIVGALSVDIPFEHPFCTENGDSFEIYAGTQRFELEYDSIKEKYQDGDTDFFVLSDGLTIGITCFNAGGSLDCKNMT